MLVGRPNTLRDVADAELDDFDVLARLQEPVSTCGAGKVLRKGAAFLPLRIVTREGIEVP
jgi:hypothetical protein